MSAGTSPLVVGVDLAPPGALNLGVPGSPEFRGFEVDLLGELSRRLNRGLRFRAALWAGLLEELQAGGLDLICTAVTRTPEREQQFAFSRSYLRLQLALICRNDRTWASLDDMQGDMAVRVNTPAEWYVRQNWRGPVRTYHHNTEVYEAVAAGAAAGAVDDLPIGAYFAHTMKGLRVVTALPGTESEYAMVMRHGHDDLRAGLDRALGQLQADGTYGRLYRQWLEPFLGDRGLLSTGS